MRQRNYAVLVILCIVNLFNFNNTLFAVDCGDGPAYPQSGDYSMASGSPSGDAYATSFTIYLQPTQDYTSWKITEYDASPGTDSCANQFTNPAFIPPTPGVSGGVWYAEGNVWGPDNVGWLPGSINYMVQNPGVVTLVQDSIFCELNG